MGLITVMVLEWRAEAPRGTMMRALRLMAEAEAAAEALAVAEAAAAVPGMRIGAQ